MAVVMSWDNCQMTIPGISGTIKQGTATLTTSTGSRLEATAVDGTRVAFKVFDGKMVLKARYFNVSISNTGGLVKKGSVAISTTGGVQFSATSAVVSLLPGFNDQEGFYVDVEATILNNGSTWYTIPQRS